jgi:hypothetical protein
LGRRRFPATFRPLKVVVSLMGPSIRHST